MQRKIKKTNLLLCVYYLHGLALLWRFSLKVILNSLNHHKFECLCGTNIAVLLYRKDFLN